jgi:hypothetical protein
MSRLKQRGEHNPRRSITYCACVPHVLYYRNEGTSRQLIKWS